MEITDLADRVVLLEVALGAALRVLPGEAAEEFRTTLAEHLEPLPDDLDAAVAGAVARLIGLV